MKGSASEKVFVRFGGKETEVETLKEASRLFRAWVESKGYGASDLSREDGDLSYADGRVFATVSYNGRIWEVVDGRGTGVEIFA